MPILLLFSLLFYDINLIAGNSVTVHLDAKWSNTPLISEAGEYFAAESADLFWKYTEYLSEMQDKLSAEHDDIHNHELVTKIAKKLLNSGQISVLQLSLATRLYSSAVEMNHQLDTDLSCEHSSTFSRVLGQFFCDLNIFLDFISNYKGSKDNNPVIYKTDKIYPGIESLSEMIKDRLVVILYSDLQDKQFYTWHSAVAERANKHEIYYVFRHRIKNRSEKKTRLSGYGVELAIKSTEYKAVDDTRPPGSSQDDSSDMKTASGVENNDNLTNNAEDEVQGFIFSQLKQLHPTLTDDLDTFKQHLLKSDLSEIKPMKAWQIQELSLKAAQLVMNSLVNNEALETLRDISQNFPVRAHHLSEVQVTQDFKNELLVNQAVLEQSYGLQPGQSLVTFNGFALSQDLDLYEILDLARREMGVMTRLHNFGLQGDHISSLMNVQHSGSEGTNAASQFLLDIRQAPIVYINNLEKDRRYSSWPKSVSDLLTPTYPGMMRRVAKNLFNTIIVLDPAQAESRDFVKFAEAFVIHNAPIRMGFLWAVDPSDELESSPGRALIRAFNFVSSENDDPLSGLSFITDFYSSFEDNEVITVQMVKAFLKKKHPDYDMEITFGVNSDYDNNVKASWKYLHESGIINLQKPFLLINGLLIDSKSLTESGFEEIVVNNVLLSTGELQKLVVEQKLSDAVPVLDILLSGDNVVNRLNNKILQNNNMRYISFTTSMDFSINVTKDSLKDMSEDYLSTYIADTTKYFVKNDDHSSIKSTTIWIVTDVETNEGKKLLHESIRWVQSSHISRVALIQNPSIENKNSLLNKIINNIIKKLSADIARSMIVSLLTDNSGMSTSDVLNKIINERNNDKELLTDLDDVSENYLMVEESFVKNVIKGRPGESFVIINGKVYSSFSVNETFIKDDYKLIEQSCSGASRLLDKLKEILGSGINKAKLLSDLTNKVHATLQKDLAKSSTSAQIGIMSNSKKIEVKGLSEEHTGFTLMGHISKPAFDLVAIIDPLSRLSQKLSHIMIVLKDALNLNVRVLFNCKDKLSETPLKSFYRFVLDPSPVTKDANGNPISMSNPKAQFTRLPSQPLLTLGLEPIHNWLVEATKSVYDLDNIRLSEVKNGMVLAFFELEYLLLEGHCVDLTTGQPPRGLQFVLSGNDAQKTTHDTIVMANLGYFQLKANPGAWNLKLRDGKSKDIYDIIDHEFTDSEEKSPDVVAVLNSFRAKIIRVKVNKKVDKVNENVLSESKLDEETSSIWASISSAFSNKKTDSKNETINIFSVASGHLYERFLRLMMLSVTKHTKSKVKFWFLKNFLSPTFKQFIPHMAKKYGFEYDLVQYKWPRWLHQQTEKQRIIWGYKILFLDVLFPLNVSKIIFVDADQTVRADLQELVDLDLEGAPYGYTPFCNSRKEMDGFRFWKSGYWSQHLAGRPYHISALYVVDLNRFRLMAAGDRLRGQYHGLSQDPNSLSNLDQDLPNNMIHQVPIKSLPQEWLWCETWCSEDEKKNAKTIDLCNNPMTKEPKLSAAARIVPEWKEYDEEIKALWSEVYSMKPHIPGVIPSNDPHTVFPDAPKTEL